mgnify:FL=1
MAKDKTKKVLESERWAFDRVRHGDVRYKIDEFTPYSELFPIHDSILTDNNYEILDEDY